ncbi:hypothetical protein F2Q69_00006059 [Brassica cretica]|uniref:Uncharacterized protein n=1 Tax=Brassica cretica TaxID=69181 RepID=A0A8S9P9C3_BRACR|nr:hypothetical protein F2Q69_00006059 [Brassica cretica]
MSTRSNKGIGFLLVEPLDLERVIHKSKRVVDTLQAAIGSIEIQVSIDTAHPTSIDTAHLTSIDTAHLTSIDTVHPPSTDTVHLPSQTTCLEAEKVDVLILTVDENGMLRDEEDRTRNSTGQLINAEGAVIPDVTYVAETNNFDLNREWYDWESVDPFRGLPHEDPRDLIKELEEFLASLDEEYMIPIQLLDDIMAKRDEQHVSGEPSRVEEDGTKDTTSMSIDITTSTSIDITTSTSIDITTLTLIDSMTSMSTDDKTLTSINRSTQKSTDESSCVLVPDVDREITIEDFLELEDKTTPENLDHNLEKKLDDHQHPSEKDLETSLEASIGRHQPDEIDRQPSHNIDLHPPDNDLHRQPLFDRHHPPNIDLFPLLDIPPGCIIEMELIEERMYMSKASHLDVPKHQRQPIWTEEAAGFHKRVKRIHDPVKIGVPCAVFEVESPIPPDRSMQFSSYIEVLDDHQHVEAS